jgi:hypothetical protein
MIEREPPVTEDELHAYVDGQLADDRRGAVEQWLAEHAEDAARVAAWRAQADAMRARYGAIADEPVPPRFDIADLFGNLIETKDDWVKICDLAYWDYFLVPRSRRAEWRQYFSD